LPPHTHNTHHPPPPTTSPLLCPRPLVPPKNIYYIKFPFEAKIKNEKNSKNFKVLRFTSIVSHRVVCEIEFEEGIRSRMPLTEIEPLDKKSSNNTVINDYLKFIKEDYE